MQGWCHKSITVPTSLGFAVGLLIAAPFCFDEAAGSVMSAMPVLESVWNVASLPGFWIAAFCLSRMDSPGHGILSETGLRVAAVATLALWTLLGFLVGLWRHSKLHEEGEPPPEALTGGHP
jgi:hypothetical protein